MWLEIWKRLLQKDKIRKRDSNCKLRKEISCYWTQGVPVSIAREVKKENYDKPVMFQSRYF